MDISLNWTTLVSTVITAVIVSAGTTISNYLMIRSMKHIDSKITGNDKDKKGG